MGLEAKLTWEKVENSKPSNYAHFNAGSTTLVGGYVYATFCSDYKENIYVFSLATQTWHNFWRYSAPRDHVPMLVDDKLYLLGGLVGRGIPYTGISEIDLVIGKLHEFSGVSLPYNHCAVYDEKRGDIVMYGNESWRVYRFNVDSKQLAQYHVTGSFKPSVSCTSRQSMVAANGDIYVFDNCNLGNDKVIHILTLGDPNTARWSRVLFGLDRSWPDLRRMAAGVMGDLLVLFGGFRGRWNTPNAYDLYLYDTRTEEGEVLNIENLGTCTSTGSWPVPWGDGLSGISNAVIANKTMWFFGESNAGMHIYKLEIDREKTEDE